MIYDRLNINERNAGITEAESKIVEARETLAHPDAWSRGKSSAAYSLGKNTVTKTVLMGAQELKRVLGILEVSKLGIVPKEYEPNFWDGAVEGTDSIFGLDHPVSKALADNYRGSALQAAT